MEDMHYRPEKGDAEDVKWLKLLRLLTTRNKGNGLESTWEQRHPGEALMSATSYDQVENR
jgi:hypothetical protein